DGAALTFWQPGECLGDSFRDSAGLEPLVHQPRAAGRIQRLNRHCRAAGPNLVDTKIISDSVQLRADGGIRLLTSGLTPDLERTLLSIVLGLGPIAQQPRREPEEPIEMAA
ncbi:MAG: hypothetical protein OSB69_18225, partial [Alphaproteobacteria bacterium]|nr:hypothetical protein [Alphaproteobacteria bacterium]